MGEVGSHTEDVHLILSVIKTGRVEAEQTGTQLLNALKEVYARGIRERCEA
jgi:hypothetical protein